MQVIDVPVASNGLAHVQTQREFCGVEAEEYEEISDVDDYTDDEATDDEATDDVDEW